MSKIFGAALAVVALIASLVSGTAAFATSTWDIAENLNLTGTPSAPKVVASASGDVTVLWKTNTGSDQRIMSSTGQFGAWMPNMLDQGTLFDGYNLTIDGSGNATAAWTKSNGLNNGYKSNTGASGVWGPPEIISTYNTDGLINDVAANSSGKVVAVELNGSEILASTKIGNQTWVTTIAVTMATPTSLQVVVDENGNATMAWTALYAGYEQIYVSTQPAGQSWSVPQRLTSAVGSVTNFDLISDSQGNLTIAFVKASRLWWIQKLVSGSWNTSQSVSSNVVNDASIAVDESGTVSAAWYVSNTIKYSQLPLGGSWSAPGLVANTSAASTVPALGADPSGNLTAAWGVGGIQYGAVKLSTSATWEAQVALNTDDSVNAVSAPSIYVSTMGKAAVAWQRGNEILTSSVTNPMVRVPVFSVPVPTADGFTVNVTNYNPSWSWVATATGGASVVTGTASGNSLPLIVSGLGALTTSSLTVTSSRSGYVDSSESVSGTSLNAALNPTFSSSIKNSSGFTADITNYDPSWTWSVISSAGSASIVTTGGTKQVVVTSLTAGQNADVTVSTERAGYASGSSVLQSSALGAQYLPTFGNAVRTADGFTVDILNYDANYGWTNVVDHGIVAFSLTSGTVMNLVVSGLTPGQSATLTTDTSRSGYVSGQSSIISSALVAARTPTFSSPVKTADGFTVSVTNYDGSWNWSSSVSSGSVVAGVASGATLPLTVSGVSAGGLSTLTVVTSRSGYVDGSGSVMTTALNAARTPTFSAPVQTADGFTVNVTNYNASWTWTPFVSTGSVLAGTVSGSILPLTISGVSAGTASTLTMDTIQSGYVSGSATVLSSALALARTPTFDTPIRTATGFTVNITNYNAGWTWTPSVSSGSVSVGSASGSTLPLTVTGVASSASSILSIDATRAGYLTGTATVSGTALGAALVPTFDTPVATPDGFTVNVTNYNASWSWAFLASSGTLVTGTPVGSTIALTLSGLNPGATALITVDTARSSFASGQEILAGATRAAQTPTSSIVLSAAIGQPIAGSTATITATGMQSAASYSVTVYSTPQVIGSGHASAGIVTTTQLLPTGLSEGWHRIVFTTTAFSGAAYEETLYFKMSSTGTLLATSQSVPAELAITGSSTIAPSVLLVLLSFGVGVLLIRGRRRLASAE